MRRSRIRWSGIQDAIAKVKSTGKKTKKKSRPIRWIEVCPFLVCLGFRALAFTAAAHSCSGMLQGRERLLVELVCVRLVELMRANGELMHSLALVRSREGRREKVLFCWYYYFFGRKTACAPTKSSDDVYDDVDDNIRLFHQKKMRDPTRTRATARAACMWAKGWSIQGGIHGGGYNFTNDPL